jgi:hypothetical protein
MKSFILTFISFCLISVGTLTQTTYADDFSNELYANVLGSYVTDGLVDYAGLKSDPEDLNKYLKQTSSVSKNAFDRWTESEQLAFLINLYNAQTLDLIIDHYPVKSIKDIATKSGGPWEQPVVNLFGDKITLNALEHELIRNDYPEPKVHFALVCAAMGCPILINKPYNVSILNDQLEEQTKLFLMDKEKNSINTKKKTLMLSPIFDWFKQDFIAKSGSVIDFVNPYFDNEANKKFKIKYTHYDWSLNDLASK